MKYVPRQLTVIGIPLMFSFLTCLSFRFGNFKNAGIKLRPDLSGHFRVVQPGVFRGHFCDFQPGITSGGSIGFRKERIDEKAGNHESCKGTYFSND